VLTELRVRDLAVIADVTLPFQPGLNVLTGETGAGKSMVVDALALLLGERASATSSVPAPTRPWSKGRLSSLPPFTAIFCHLRRPWCRARRRQAHSQA